jgi:hypothetical protein
MPLSGVCPACGASFALEQALTDGEARQALAAALAVPPEIGARLVRYLGLHAPAGKRVQWGKLTRLLGELTERLSAAQVTRRGVTYAAPLGLWAQAMDEVLAARDAGTLTLPLDGHGYLDEVCWRLAAKGAGKAEATAINIARGETPVASHPSFTPAVRRTRAAGSPDAASAGMRSLKSVLKGL